MTPWLQVHNSESVDASSLPIVSMGGFRDAVTGAVRHDARLVALTILPTDQPNHFRLMAALAFVDTGMLSLIATDVGAAYSALTPECAQAHWFEREIAEIWNITPEGHPWLKPIRFQPVRRAAKGGKQPAEVGRADFFHMDGHEVHEVAVGPVHAGVIEPGHFRFQCHGETVHHLEISLGYQHRGIERALIGGPDARTIHYMETAAGDTSIAHSTAYSRAHESLAGVSIPARAEAIRSVAAELERIANHVGDLGALAGDVGFLPTQNYCGRIRGDVLNCTALLCGNRFGRGLVRPGGVAWDLDAALIVKMKSKLEEIERDCVSAIDLMFTTPSVLARLDGTGPVPLKMARELGLVGVAARASGVECDVRRDFSCGMYRFVHLPICTWTTGDCFARAYVRWLEVRQSFQFLQEQLSSLPEGGIHQPCGPLRPGRMVLAMTEGWRGEICHIAMTDKAGRFSNYKIIDPSFHNWFGLACALRGQAISDFPLCNKSFNLSYCGHDL